MKKLSLILLLLTKLCLAEQFRDLSGAGSLPAIDELTFTSTAKWDAKYLPWLKLKPAFLPNDWQGSIVLPKPPDNSSPRTKAELETLLSLKTLRPERKARTNAELDVKNFKLGEVTYGELTSHKKFTQTGKLLQVSYKSIASSIFIMKRKFNRPRPHIIAAKHGIDLHPSIKVPGHPAYPSGHATEAFAIAYILQELDPANAPQYLRDAAQIAENREIAGVHYASDSEAGRLLARQLVDAFLRDSKFNTQLAKARREWPAPPTKK